MTPNLLDELEKILALSEKATPAEWGVFVRRDGKIEVGASHNCCPVAAMYVPLVGQSEANAAIIAASVNFLRTHHATLADMAKRMEAAKRKLSRLTAMRNEWERDAREHLMTFGQHLPASVECLVERFDAAIDATQEGEG